MRIWKSLLTNSQILAYKDKRLDSSHSSISSIIGYWKCDEGTDYIMANSAYLLNSSISSSFDVTIKHMTSTSVPTNLQATWSTKVPPAFEVGLGGFAGGVDSSQNAFVVGCRGLDVHKYTPSSGTYTSNSSNSINGTLVNDDVKRRRNSSNPPTSIALSNSHRS